MLARHLNQILITVCFHQLIGQKHSTIGSDEPLAILPFQVISVIWIDYCFHIVDKVFHSLTGLLSPKRQEYFFKLLNFKIAMHLSSYILPGQWLTFSKGGSMINLSFYSRLRILECEDCICFLNKKLPHDKLQFLSLFHAIYTCSKDCINCFFYKSFDGNCFISRLWAILIQQ